MSHPNAPRALKIPPEPPKIIRFLLRNKGVAGVTAGAVNPATPLGRPPRSRPRAPQDPPEGPSDNKIGGISLSLFF